ncbi:hypothetical protein JCM14076_15930 [Methylosoma difficile]
MPVGGEVGTSLADAQRGRPVIKPETVELQPEAAGEQGIPGLIAAVEEFAEQVGAEGTPQRAL